MTETERSTSRGREAFQSTGRGGLGNIRQTSASRDARPDSGPDDFSVTRGREPVPSQHQVYSTGRGGAGNLRSPSRDTSKARPDSNEQEVIREYVVAHENAPFSSGRGGVGNINRSRSRDPSGSLSSVVHSTGRGGAGNIVSGDGAASAYIDEEERRKHSTSHDGIHSTGRGGTANLTHTGEPAIEHHSHDHKEPEFESTGRGGVGNIVRERSASRTRA
ncbi:hypothetical protein BDZ97DRAFT_1849317 [Flammula alnicola]|nr:hypothetical protein BDZ97DRAFT_1849317 [Flammula alnicola]